MYLATRVDTPSKVAIKFFRPSLDDSPNARRFRREKQILAALDHPNIVHYIDYGETSEGWRYFVMEHVEGSTILAYCNENFLSVRKRLSLFLQVLSAVEHAHHRYILRDLTPSNVLVTKHGRVKILDFGTAKPLYPDVGSLDPEDFCRDTPLTLSYASPKLLAGRDVDTLSDQYQLGVILFQLLTKQRPFEEAGLSEEGYKQRVMFDLPPLVL